MTLPASLLLLLKSIGTVIGTSDPPVAIERTVLDIGVRTLTHGMPEPVLSTIA